MSNPVTALVATIGFWVVVVFLGWVGVAVLGPRNHSVLWQWGYFIAALAVVGLLSLPAKVRAKLRGKQY